MDSKIQRIVQQEIHTAPMSQPVSQLETPLSQPPPPSGYQSTQTARPTAGAGAPSGGTTQNNTELYLGFEKANGKRTWCEFLNQTERSRLTRNGWNMVWSTKELQDILKWVNDADQARVRPSKDAEQEAVPSHINLPVTQAQPAADATSRASSDPPGS